MTALALPTEALPPLEPDPAVVVAVVCARWGLDRATVTAGGLRGSRRVSLARRACCVALRRLCPSRSLHEIGDAVGLDHTTVIHHLRIAGIIRAGTGGEVATHRLRALATQGGGAGVAQ